MFCTIDYSINYFHLYQPIHSYLPSSVSIYAKGSEGASTGSGVVFINNNKTFVWTCKHVIDTAITQELNIDIAKQTTEYKFELGKVQAITKLHNENMDEAGYIYVHAKIIRFSTQDDLALLELSHNGIFKETVRFPTNPKYTPQIGFKVYHVGSMGGLSGHHAMAEGHQGQQGVQLQDCKMDRIALNIQQGSSGGGVFEYWSGRCIGLAARSMDDKSFNQCYIIPWRHMHAFASRLDCHWALNSNISVPDNYLENLTEDKLVIDPQIIKILSPSK